MAGKRFEDERRSNAPDVDIHLPAVPPGAIKGHSFDEWLTLISKDQRAFIEAPTNKSIRLKGPAGSGKTLAIYLKAIREVLAARESSEDLRVLIVTHSWGLAAQIQASIDMMGLGAVREIDVFPLLGIADSLLPPQYRGSNGLTLIGEDSYSGKRAQLDEIRDVLDDFASGDWVTYRGAASSELAARIDSREENERLALAWDLLIEFGSVIGAAGIFPGAGAELKYQQLSRARWMLPLSSRGDLHVVWVLYSKYMESLETRSLITSDQLLSDFLNFLETHAWNRSRKDEGYDLVFVDEFHLFSPLERRVLHYLTRDVKEYPRIFMAVDPNQSPSEAFIGAAADETLSATVASAEDGIGDVANFELSTVHRFSPQILNLIKHVHLSFPTFDLGNDWHVDLSTADSSQADGPVPVLISSPSREAEANGINRAVHDLYSRGRVALAVVDIRQWSRFSNLASQMGTSGKFQVSTITGRSDIENLGYKRKGLVVGYAEYLAGLQFETVLVAGLPDMRDGIASAIERNRALSLLYLALSRAEREVRIFVNDDDGGVAEVLDQAVANHLMKRERADL